MKNIKEEYFDDINVFFESIRQYSKDIKGSVLCADKIPYIGFVVYDEADELDDKAKHFLIDCKHVKNAPPLAKEAMKSNAGKINLAKSLECK